MRVLFEIDSGEEVKEFHLEGSPAQIRRDFLHYARMPYVRAISVWRDNGTRLMHCDNQERTPQ